MKEYFDILLTFMRVGVMTFGGGYAMIPVVERELIKRKGWIPIEEVMNYYTVSQIIPGIIGVNLSAFVGYKRKGVLGGILAPIGFILPGITFIVILALFLGNFAEIPVVGHAFAGIRIAVGALILDTVIKLAKGVLKGGKTWGIFLTVFAVSILPAGLIVFGFIKSPVFLIIASGLIGILLFRSKKPPAGPPKEKS
ncbi:MAG: chromate transporter [Treponema sp.]|nr:chromate transporter [Treponema sp.]